MLPYMAYMDPMGSITVTYNKPSRTWRLPNRPPIRAALNPIKMAILGLLSLLHWMTVSSQVSVGSSLNEAPISTPIQMPDSYEKFVIGRVLLYCVCTWTLFYVLCTYAISAIP